jgi:hypothetical protein
MSNEILVDGSGPILERAKIVLSFQGAGWKDGLMPTSEVRRAFDAVLASPYMSHLVQYRGIRRPEIVLAIEDFTNLGTLGPDPRKFVAGNIWLVTDDDVRNVARAAFKARPPAQGEQVFYLTVLSQSPIPISLVDIKAGGYHSSFPEGDGNIIYGLLLHVSTSTLDDSQHLLPGIFCHETAEACSDPGPSPAFSVTNINSDGGALEISDANRTVPAQVPGFKPETSLALYWSELERQLVAPTTYSLRVALGKRSHQAVPSVAALIHSHSIMQFILDGFNA